MICVLASIRAASGSSSDARVLRSRGVRDRRQGGRSRGRRVPHAGDARERDRRRAPRRPHAAPRRTAARSRREGAAPRRRRRRQGRAGELLGDVVRRVRGGDPGAQPARRAGEEERRRGGRRRDRRASGEGGRLRQGARARVRPAPRRGSRSSPTRSGRSGCRRRSCSTAPGAWCGAAGRWTSGRCRRSAPPSRVPEGSGSSEETAKAPRRQAERDHEVIELVVRFLAHPKFLASWRLGGFPLLRLQVPATRSFDARGGPPPVRP